MSVREQARSLIMVGVYTAGGNVKWYSHNRNSMLVPQKIKHRISIWSSNRTSGYISKRTESRFSKRYLYTHIYSSIVHNSQEVEATLVCIGR